LAGNGPVPPKAEAIDGRNTINSEVFLIDFTKILEGQLYVIFAASLTTSSAL
jgi:hypothetical protein